MSQRPTISPEFQTAIGAAGREHTPFTKAVICALAEQLPGLTLPGLQQLHSAVSTEKTKCRDVRPFLHQHFVKPGVLGVFKVQGILNWPVEESDPIRWELDDQPSLESIADRVLERYFRFGWQIEGYVRTRKILKTEASVYYYRGEQPVAEGASGAAISLGKKLRNGLNLREITGSLALSRAFVTHFARQGKQPLWQQDTATQALLFESQSDNPNDVSAKDATSRRVLVPCSEFLWDAFQNAAKVANELARISDPDCDEQPGPEKTADCFRQLIRCELLKIRAAAKSRADAVELW